MDDHPHTPGAAEQPPDDASLGAAVYPPAVVINEIDDQSVIIGSKDREGSVRSFNEECERLRDLERQLINRALAHQLTETPLKPAFIVREMPEEPQTCWFIGDTHGDLTALLTAYSYIETQTILSGEDKPLIIFLGDLIDRGGNSREVIDFILDLSHHERYETILIKGNHDAGLGIRDGVFHSNCIPAEYIDELNNPPFDDETASYPGLAAIELFRDAPAALVLKYGEQGVLVTHGGVPHSDIQELWRQSERSFHDLYQDPALEGRMARDFIWTRLHYSARFKRPNRSSQGCQLGIDNVRSFVELFREKTGISLTTIIRGHDHEEKGYRHYEKYIGQTIITLNNMTASAAFPERKPVVARWQQGQDIQIMTLEPPPVFLPDRIATDQI